MNKDNIINFALFIYNTDDNKKLTKKVLKLNAMCPYCRSPIRKLVDISELKVSKEYQDEEIDKSGEFYSVKK